MAKIQHLTSAGCNRRSLLLRPEFPAAYPGTGNALRVLSRAGIKLSLVALFAGCGVPPYQTIQLLSPSPSNESTVTIGPVEVGLRMGAEWAEVRLRNAGDTAIEVDWGAATLFEHGGESHRLIEPHLFSEFYIPVGLLARQRDPEAAQLAALRSMAHQELGSHRAPAWLERSRRRDSQVLRPGTSVLKVLYPAEHIRAGPHGWVVVAPLFCRRGAREGRTFTMHLRFRTGEVWQTAAIVGQAGGRRKQ